MQEEPRNMGAWSYLSPRLTPLTGTDVALNVIARPERASPASGFMDLILAEQNRILTLALSSLSIERHPSMSLANKERGGKYVR